MLQVTTLQHKAKVKIADISYHRLQIITEYILSQTSDHHSAKDASLHDEGTRHFQVERWSLSDYNSLLHTLCFSPFYLSQIGKCCRSLQAQYLHTRFATLPLYCISPWVTGSDRESESISQTDPSLHKKCTKTNARQLPAIHLSQATEWQGLPEYTTDDPVKTLHP